MASQGDRIDMDFTFADEQFSDTPTVTRTNSTLPPPLSKRGRSDVWVHFEVVEGDNEFAACNFCGTKIKYVYGTSSMRMHLSRCKQNPDKESNKKKRQGKGASPAIEGQVAASPSYPKFDQDACRVQLAKTFVSAELPFRFVENKEFRKLLIILQPRFDIPSRSTLRRDIWNLYIDEKVKLKRILSKHCGRVCLTTDTWTSVQNLTYMSLTAHYVDCEWKLQKKILNFCQITGHTGEDIAMYIEDYLNDWDLKRVLTITVDNATANDAGLRYLKSRMQSWDTAVLNGDYLHMRCSAHILNLVVKEGLKVVDDSILRIRCAVKYVKGSPARLKRFMDCAEHERLSHKNCLVLDVDTRWNSTFSMLNSAIKYQNAFNLFQLRDKPFSNEMKKGSGLLTDADWNHAKTILPFLEMFLVSTENMSGSSYVTSNLFMTEIFRIGTKISKHCESANASIKKMAMGMKSKYDKYWGDFNSINILLLIGVVLDPRTKYAYVEFYIDFISTDDSKANEMKLKVMSSLKSLYNQYQGIEAGSQSSQIDSQPDDDDDPLCRYLQKTGRRADPQTELDRYLKEDPVPYNRSVHFDILSWWKVNEIRFPILASIAREVLAIPVSTSTVASECAFSTGGRILSDHRSCLTHTIVEALVCLQDWLKGQPLSQFYDDPDEIYKFEQEVCSQTVNLDD